MKLAASLVVRNELDRYLSACVTHLREFCDIVCVLDDGSDDDTETWLHDQADGQLIVERQETTTFYTHEGRTRQLLIDVTLEQRPDFVISLDADEFVNDGIWLRTKLEDQPAVPVWCLAVTEVWNADAEHLYAREDGGWRTHPLACVWRVDPRTKYTMLNRALACRRVPTQVLAQPHPQNSGVNLLHFGWANKATRQQRYDRYAKHDGGRFHASAHLRSILWDDRRVQLREMPWPDGPVFDKLRERLTGGQA